MRTEGGGGIPGQVQPAGLPAGAGRDAGGETVRDARVGVVPSVVAGQGCGQRQSRAWGRLGRLRLGMLGGGRQGRVGTPSQQWAGPDSGGDGVKAGSLELERATRAWEQINKREDWSSPRGSAAGASS